MCKLKNLTNAYMITSWVSEILDIRSDMESFPDEIVDDQGFRIRWNEKLPFHVFIGNYDAFVHVSYLSNIFKR